MYLKGKVIKLGGNINTDFIISGRYKFSITNIKELSKHLMEDIDPDFPKKIKPGKTILVAGKNFGMGSSREQAPLVIKESGIIAIIAESFDRIFYRNCFNIGLPIIEAETSRIRKNDIIRIDLSAGLIKNITQNTTIVSTPLPHVMRNILKSGGIINYYKRFKSLPLRD